MTIIMSDKAYILIAITVAIVLIGLIPSYYHLYQRFVRISRRKKFKKKHGSYIEVGYSKEIERIRPDVIVHSVNGDAPAYRSTNEYYPGKRISPHWTHVLFIPEGEVEIRADYVERPEGHRHFHDPERIMELRPSSYWDINELKRQIYLDKQERPDREKKHCFVLKFTSEKNAEYFFDYKYYEGILYMMKRDPKTNDLTIVAKDSKRDPVEEPNPEPPKEKVFH